MAIAIVFLLGIANFAMHRAVLDSGHVVVRAMTGGSETTARVTLALEFILLLSALLAASADPRWAWAYVGYSVFNLLAGWAILTRRI